jgi:signal transduction histidine kinase
MKVLLDRVPKSILIYLLSAYVLVQFIWWAYMLVDLNATIYSLKLQLLQGSELPLPEQLVQKAELDRALALKVWMVLGEGAVFVFILVLGFWAVKRSIAKELALAEQQKNFLLSITHELKSPLAAIKLQIQTLLSRDLPKDLQHQLLERAIDDSNRLEKLVENLLLVNKVESGKLPLQKQRINLQEVILKLISARYASSPVQFSTENDPYGLADPIAIESVLVNLIDNALKYAPNGPVQVNLTKENGQIILTVSDSGKGIPPKEKQRIFERFYRIGNEDTRSTKGTGIGLYLVKTLVELHHGQITVHDNEPMGTVFKVVLPAHDHLAV